MANTSSAKKAVRKIARRTAVNKSRRSEMRTYVRKVEEAIASKDPKIAADALREAEPLVARAAQKGILHKNTAARKSSRAEIFAPAQALGRGRILRRRRTRISFQFVIEPLAQPAPARLAALGLQHVLVMRAGAVPFRWSRRHSSTISTRR
jgi:small subunit ribosomal protein S20